jgi:uncharacterized OB-fold protein
VVAGELAAQGQEGLAPARHRDRVPREFCPRCWSEDVHWERASGRASLYMWSVAHMNDLPPFSGRLPYTAAAVVDLAEGPRMMTEVFGYPGAELRIGMDLYVHFRPGGADGPAARVFRVFQPTV